MELALPFELIDGIASGGAEIAVHPIVGLQWRWVGTDRLRGRNFRLGNRHLSPPIQRRLVRAVRETFCQTVRYLS